MRSRIFAFIAAAALAGSILPAQAAWHSYVSREAGFSFEAPGEVKTEKASYDSASEGSRAATVFRSLDDNIAYKVTVVDFAGHKGADDALIKEATQSAQAGKKVLADTEARVESSYGQKMTLELPNNGGRSMAAIYFSGDRLIKLEVTVLPENGDYGTPDMGRFIDSIAFRANGADQGATELRLAK